MRTPTAAESWIMVSGSSQTCLTGVYPRLTKGIWSRVPLRSAGYRLVSYGLEAPSSSHGSFSINRLSIRCREYAGFALKLEPGHIFSYTIVSVSIFLRRSLLAVPIQAAERQNIIAIEPSGRYLRAVSESWKIS